MQAEDCLAVGYNGQSKRDCLPTANVGGRYPLPSLV
jgi:hypothetical protein